MPEESADVEGAGIIDRVLEVESAVEETGHRPGEVSELLTFLFADVRGYTRFTQQYGDAAAARLTGKFAEIVRELVGEFGGTVFELRGDEAMCVFSSPRQSLRLAVALQQRFVRETADDPGLPLTVGIGVDAGEAVRSSDGYRGGALNLAARLCGVAKAGEILASREVTHLARTIDGLRYVQLARMSVKGLADPVQPVRVLPVSEDPSAQLAALLAAAPAAGPTPPLPWLPGLLGRMSRRAWAVTAALVVLVTAGVITGTSISHDAGVRVLAENSVGLIDPESGHLAGQFKVDTGPSNVAAGHGAVWTANTTANSVSEIDERTHSVTTTGVGSAPVSIALGFGYVWVTDSGASSVTRIDPASHSTQSIPVANQPSGIVTAFKSVWVTNTGASTVSRIDPAQGKVVQTIDVGANPVGITASRSALWVANSGSNSVSEITAGAEGEFRVIDTIPVGQDPQSILAVGSNIWVANNLDGTVSRIPASGTSQTGIVPVGGEPTQLASANGHLWVANGASESIAEIDPVTATPVRKIELGVIPGGVVGANGHLWVTGTSDPALHRGGTIRVALSPQTLDPSYPPDVNTGWVDNVVYDGLVTYRHANGVAGTELVPDLATAIPHPADGGKLYTFHLRTGIRWSNGRPVTVEDVKRGIQRLLASGLSSLTQLFGDCTPEDCRLPAVVTDQSAGTITIRLRRPDSGFISQLVGAQAVPAGTPLRQQTSPIASTGPYMVKRFAPGRAALLIRNPYFHQWSAAAQPAGYPDAIELEMTDVGPTGSTTRGVAAVAAGRADFVDARFGGSFTALQTKFGSRLYVTPQLTTAAVFLNTEVAPFTSSLARRAVNYAVDRRAATSDWFVPAQLTCQVLPPQMPGYRPYCPYTVRPNSTGTWSEPDLAKAQKLVSNSGTKGHSVTVWSPPPPSAGVRNVVTALNQIGYHATLKVFNSGGDYFSYVSNSRNRVQAAFFGWVAGNTNPGDFIANGFTCKSITLNSPNNANAPEFCNPAFDALVARADRAEQASPAAATQRWAAVDRALVHAAPWVPLVNPSWVDALSKRTHNYVRSPVLGPFFDQMWVH